MSLLQRAAQTFAKRSVADHYMQVARWLHTGLATTISRKSWHLLSKHRAYGRHPPRPASGTLRNRIPLHGTIRQKEALCCHRRARPDCAQLGTTRQPSHPYGLSCNDLSLPYNERGRRGDCLLSPNRSHR